ncbi:hypothetical protein V9K67_19850 [Paraflavisolibacter sp. H34]|uniref:gliding motility lipoprotein GldB n=1 Tax=Huijunlia imazamoxiresistens TaxID=3127457 RepID=UPI0030162DD8
MTRFFLFAIFVLLLSCRNGKNKPDVSHISAPVTIERFEQGFFALDTNNLAAGLPALQAKFPLFYPDFFQGILQVNPTDNRSYPVIKNVLSAYRPIYDSLEEKYRNLSGLQEELSEGFRYVKYYFPQYRMPRVVTYIGTFDAPGVVLTQVCLGIGLHQYAGKQFSVYSAPQLQTLYPAYISRRFDREYISANCLKAVADDLYPDATAGRPLIEQMIEKGKQWYLLDHFLPDAPDSVKTGYTRKQLQWLEENEGNAWAYLLKNENLYSIEPYVIQTYLGEAPSTQVMTDAAPGNIGQWIGWRIVQKYAGDHKDMKAVLQASPKTIFEEAKYRPK